MACPGDNTLAELVQGMLPEAAAADWREHIESCESCGALVAQAAKKEGAPAQPGSDSESAAAHEDAPLPRGTDVGKHLVLGPLGRGGMGMVYEAYDPDLGRKVALKLLRPDLVSAKADSRERLLREAQAMARLSHPNVTAVYEVGTFRDQMYVAMELVEGRTLTRWLREEPRSAKEVLALFIEAGRGLAAVHAAGFVHRDFKPDNVLVGDDGRARITDFGLVRTISGAGESRDLGHLEGTPSTRAFGSRAAETRTGALLGTPAYMAPEQHRGLEVDARTDQFSFCVALYEALYGERPFLGMLPDPAEEVTRGHLQAVPKLARVSASFRRVLYRGLSVRPEDRYPSMTELLGALASGPSRRRRRIALVMMVCACTAMLSAGLGHRHRRMALCQAREQSVLAKWSPVRKADIHRAFLATRASYAEDMWRRTEAVVDAYVARWRAVDAPICGATGRDALLDARRRCLDERAQQMGAVTDVLAGADASVLTNAVRAGTTLPSLVDCEGPRALLVTSALPADPVERTGVAELAAQMAKVKALHLTGQRGPSLLLAQDLVARVRKAGYRPLLAQALYELGSQQIVAQQDRAAEENLHHAAALAEALQDDVTAAHAWTQLVFVAGQVQGNLERANVFGEQAEATIERLGGDPALMAALDYYLGAALAEAQKPREAEVHLRRALAESERAFGKEHPKVDVCLEGLALVLRAQGRYEEALAIQERAVASSEKFLGPEHPSTVTGRANLASSLVLLGRLDEAVAAFERGLHRVERDEGKEHPHVIKFLQAIADAKSRQGHHDEALRLLWRAYGVAEGSFGSGHAETALCRLEIGREYAADGQFESALLQSRMALQKQSLPKKQAVRAWLTVAKSELGLGRYGRAFEALEQVKSLAGEPESDPTDRAKREFLWARALWDSGRDRPRSLELAISARDLYEQAPAGFKPMLQEVSAWLQAPARAKPLGRATARP